ncbi:MAG: rod shape-determining protein RodA [Bacteroidales bacterium]|nr:rod shape-determining protein RodA [Bacteroidales bacterium]
MREKGIIRKLDWPLAVCYLVLILFGWMNIFSALRGDNTNIFDFSMQYGKQFIWICISVALAFCILKVIPARIWNGTAWFLYGVEILLLLAVIFVGKNVNGSRSWLGVGSFALQPAELAKITISLALATLMGRYGFSLKTTSDYLKVAALVGIPALLILLEGETGSVIVFMGLLVVLYREGMSGWVIALGAFIIFVALLTLIYSPFVAEVVSIGVFFLILGFHRGRIIAWILVAALSVTALTFLPKVFEIEAVAALSLPDISIIAGGLTVLTSVILVLRSFIKSSRNSFVRNALLALCAAVLVAVAVDICFEKLPEYQQGRINVLLGKVDDPKGDGYNVHQSMIAIGSGGFLGKGFLGGTQTKFGYIPEQETDFIFCTVGEEWGFVGSIALLVIYFFMISRILLLADRNKDRFARIFGYCTAMCIAMHVVINIGMTIKLMPVIGIPLPLVSYGGSSLIAFTSMIFIFLRLDMERNKI